MKNFYYCSVGRRSVADVFFGDIVERLSIYEIGELRELTGKFLERDDEIIALWNEDPRRSLILPSLLICSDGSGDDWMAWLTTYFAKLRPISAFVRLIEQTEFATLVRRFRGPHLDSALWPAVGLIIGEVLASSGISDRQLDTLPLNSYESTLSFALLRSFAISGDTRDFVQVRDAWEAARRLTKQHLRATDALTTATICENALKAGEWIESDSSSDSEGYEFLSLCRSMLDERSDEFVERAISRIFNIDVRVNGTREERVSSFASFVEVLSSRSIRQNRGLLSLVLGFLASRIAPGTIQHSSVLAPLVSQFPESLIWYGFYAGNSRRRPAERNSHTRSGMELPAVARWIARSILRPGSPWETPTCDIAWRELSSLARTDDDPLTSIIRANQGSAEIELAPSVWTVLNVSSKAEGSDSSHRTRGYRNEQLLSVIEENLARLNMAFQELTANQSTEPQQPLFPPKRRRL